MPHASCPLLPGLASPLCCPCPCSGPAWGPPRGLGTCPRWVGRIKWTQPEVEPCWAPAPCYTARGGPCALQLCPLELPAPACSGLVLSCAIKANFGMGQGEDMQGQQFPPQNLVPSPTPSSCLSAWMLLPSPGGGFPGHLLVSR